MSAARFDPRRKPVPRRLGQTVVIACEGLKTEPLYFEGIRRHLRASTIDFVLVRHEGTDPLTVVTAAENKRAELKKGKRWLDGDTAWAVFDGEEHLATGGDRERWNTAVQRAAAQGIRLAISNPSFELWYLLHFQDQQAALHRAQALAELRAHVPGYEKNRGLFAELHAAERTQQAATRAQALCRSCGPTGWDQWRNPSTRVYELVEHLLRLPRP